MFSQLSLVCSLALLSAASPLVSRNAPAQLPLARRLNLTAGTKIPDVDQARAKDLKNAIMGPKSDDGVNPVPVINSAVIYTAEVCTIYAIYYKEGV